MALVLLADLPPLDQTALACGYVRALGQSPAGFALPRIEELLGGLNGVLFFP